MSQSAFMRSLSFSMLNGTSLFRLIFIILWFFSSCPPHPAYSQSSVLGSGVRFGISKARFSFLERSLKVLSCLRSVLNWLRGRLDMGRWQALESSCTNRCRSLSFFWFRWCSISRMRSHSSIFCINRKLFSRKVLMMESRRPSPSQHPTSSSADTNLCNCRRCYLCMEQHPHRNDGIQIFSRAKKYYILTNNSTGTKKVRNNIPSKREPRGACRHRVISIFHAQMLPYL